MTKDQQKMVQQAIGDGSSWPKATTDPQVNHRVDQLVMDEDIPDWANMSASEREMYAEEAHYNRSFETF